MTETTCGQNLQGKRVTVMGLGSFGGGVGVVKYLAARRAHVTVTDVRSELELASSLRELPLESSVTWHLGGHRHQDFSEADLIVVNPAVRSDSPFLQTARQQGIPLTSEMNLFWQQNSARVIGVTGSNGKSTTAAMIHSILCADGIHSWLGGNLGGSLLPVVGRIARDDWVVLELSSFQLDDLDRLQASPEVAVVTNFSPNHLDRHGTIERYRCAKQTILRWQSRTQIAVLNQDDADVADWPGRGRRLWFGQNDEGRQGVFREGVGETVRLSEQAARLSVGRWLRVPGRHNVANALAAACATLAVGVDSDSVRRGLMAFPGLPHRLEFVAAIDGVQFYNDSLATTPESVQAALDAFSEPIVLIAGGYDKQVDLTSFADAMTRKAKAVALVGQTAMALAHGLKCCSSGQPPEHQICPTFDEAFGWAIDRSAPGDVVLLSPGCASYDMFRNFADRGDRFKSLVAAWHANRNTTHSSHE